MTLDEVILWGTCGRAALVAHFGSLAAAQVEWARRRSLVNANPGTTPEAFWALDGPAGLRVADPRVGSSHEDRIAAAAAVEAKRGKWLADHGGDWLALGADV